MALDDYTHLPVGTEIEGVAVEICPHCKRNALPETLPGGGRTFHHGQVIVAATQDNLPLAAWDSCPKPKAR
jgi:hypothetical protein